MAPLLSSSLAFHPERPDRALARALGMGFAGVEFLCEPPWHPAAWGAEVVRGVRAAEAEISLHAPVADSNLMSPHPGVRAWAEEEIAATLRLAAELGARTVTFHIGYRPLAGVPHGPPWEEALAAARRLKGFADNLGVVLCLENDPQHPHAYLADLRRFHEILLAVGLSGTLDLGHAWISHRAEALALVPPLVPRLRVVHLHDNRGTADDHLALGEGEIPLAPAWAMLEAVPVAVVETKGEDELRRSRSWLARATGRDWGR